ncbi:MAG: hypothetical protein M0Q40_01240 [Limnochordia bacterium]|nr:hypothetical protein [Limnochordia bacterium]
MGRKSRAKREKRAREVQDYTDKNVRRRLVEDAHRKGVIDREKVDFRSSPSTLPKLSERVLQVAEIFTKRTKTDRHCQVIIELALVAWNLSVLPPKARLDAINNLRKTSPEIWVLVQPLLQRKEQLFPDDKRAIVSYEISWENDTLNLTVLHAETGQDEVSG